MATKKPSGWAIGWTAFAAIIMIMMGAWWVITGFAGILNDTVFVTGQNWILKLDLTQWGWIHLILGIVIVVAGVGLFSAKVWARVLGVIIAIVAGVAAFGWLPYYPVWGVIYIAIAVLVVWSLTVHGQDITMT